MKTFKQLMHAPEQDTLNPKLWNNDETLNGTIRESIMERAGSFLERLGFSANDIDDVRIVGGNASYNYHAASDIDATIVVKRDLNLTKEDVRRIGISSSNLNYKLSPSINGIPLNFYFGTRNISPLRPAKQAVYSITKQKFLVGPTKMPEVEPNHIAGKANFFASLIEECIDDESNESEDCSKKLLDRLKRYRLRGLKTKDGEFSTQNLVWRVLSRSNYIQVLKDKVGELEKSYYRVKTPSIIQNEEFKMLIKEGTGIETIPQSIVRWNKRILMGKNPLAMLARVKAILALFDDGLFDVTENTRSTMPVVVG